VATAVIAAPAHADSFYAGKTITIVTSTGPGGTYDIGARAIARVMPRHIPGNPAIIVQNMPGGGNMLATNYMYAIAPKDGTAIAVVNNAVPLQQVLNGHGVRYDAGKFNWLGSTGAKNSAVFVLASSGIRTIQDVMGREITIGGTGAGSSLVVFPAAMNAVLSTKFKIVIGYKSSEDISLAMERGEVEARVLSYSAILKTHPDWITKQKIVTVVQIGIKRDKELPDVPLMTELAKADEQRAILKLISLPIPLGQPYLAPPGTPMERVATLRQAFAATMKDKAFLTDAEKLQLELDPMGAEETTEIVRETIATPLDIVAKAKAAMGPMGEGQ